MPVSIKMYKIKKHPEHYPVKSVQVNPGFTSASFYTEVRQLGKSEYTEIDLTKLLVEHHVGEKFEGVGYLEDGSQYDLIAVSTIEKFPCFLEGNEFLYTSGTKREISEQALARLRRYPDLQNQLLAEPVKINLVELKQEILQNGDAAIKGGWFRGMQIENVEVAYLGGGSVTESSDWERYETSGGTISALRIDVPTLDVEEETIKLLLTKDGNCVIYRNFGEQELLKIAMPLFQVAKEFLE